jgi:hypothetical protein
MGCHDYNSVLSVSVLSVFQTQTTRRRSQERSLIIGSWRAQREQQQTSSLSMDEENEDRINVQGARCAPASSVVVSRSSVPYSMDTAVHSPVPYARSVPVCVTYSNIIFIVTHDYEQHGPCPFVVRASSSITSGIQGGPVAGA